MVVYAASVEVPFLDGEGALVGTLSLFAPSGSPDAIQLVDDDDVRDGVEAPIQLVEATQYEYQIKSSGLRARLASGRAALRPSANPANAGSGTLNLGSYVGRLRLQLIDESDAVRGSAAIEVTTRKLGYRDDLRAMMHDITAYAVDLAFELRSPTTLRAVPDPVSDARTAYQQFAFLNSLLGTKEFGDALHRIATRPHESLDRETTQRSLQRGFRPNRNALRQIARGGTGFAVPTTHPLGSIVASLPARVPVQSSKRSEDNAENQFVRFALETFARFLDSFADSPTKPISDEHVRIFSEAKALRRTLDATLESTPIRNASPLRRVPFESPVLQRREGYREVLQAWLKFDLAARLTWEGGADVYELGQRDVASLYEYWVFFRLLEILTDLAEFPNKPKQLIEETGDRLGLKLKSGKQLSFVGSATIDTQRINVRFDYNRIFVRRLPVEYAGSWSEQMRPDYSLTIWPSELTEAVADSNGQVVRVHFDAKYRVEHLEQLFGKSYEAPDDEQLLELVDEEKRQQKEGAYKRADLLKMHAYRDAIRRSYGAYVLYPGDVGRQWSEFHEILPGLGAFVLKPGQNTDALSSFILDLFKHVTGGSVREDVASYTARRYLGSSGVVT
jgi:predicted component of viral defense system (DUF524 family)